MSIDEYVSQQLKKYCGEQSITPCRLAKKSGISTSTMYSIMSGSASPKISTLNLLCETLDVPIRDFFKDWPDSELSMGIGEHLS